MVDDISSMLYVVCCMMYGNVLYMMNVVWRSIYD